MKKKIIKKKDKDNIIFIKDKKRIGEIIYKITLINSKEYERQSPSINFIAKELDIPKSSAYRYVNMYKQYKNEKN